MNKKLPIILKTQKDVSKIHLDKEIRMQQILLLIAMLGYPLFGYLNTYIHQSESENIFFQRCIFSFFIGLFLTSSFLNKYVKNNFYYVIAFFTYIGITHIFYITSTIGFSFSHSLGIVVILVCSSFVYKKTNHLTIFLLYCLITITISAYLAPKNELKMSSSIVLFYIVCFVIFFTLKLRIKSQKTIQGNQANIHALIENVEGIIWSFDHEYNFIAINKSFQHLYTSLTNEQAIIGQPFNEKNLDKNLISNLKEAYLKAFSGENISFKQEILIENETNYFSFSISPIQLEDTEIIGITIFGHDITIEKNYENSLIQSKEIAENLTRLKEDFLSNMSHEVRTPLNGIIGFTKVLLQNNNLSEIQKNQLNAIKCSGDILLVIINDILDITKIDSGKMSLESIEIDVALIAKRIINTFEERIKEKNITINFITNESISQKLLGDPVRISQILINIIGNSIKFTPEKGTIDVTINNIYESEESTHIQFEIKDSGIGIEKEKLDLIFEPFVQANSDTTRKYGGTGLGLSIVKKIITLMDGEIEVESKIGYGTKFIFRLVFKKNLLIENENKEEKIIIDSKINPENYTILLVEDNRINQMLAQTILDQFGFKVITAENGELAVDAVKNNHIDLILMDLMMSVMDGYEATIVIKTLLDESKKSIPIIALTADISSIDIEKCKKVGMNDYISKPFDTDILYRKMADLLIKK